MSKLSFVPRFERPRAPGLVLFGHRGAPRLRPENTVASFVAAWAAGADVLEMDLRQSCDGELVLLHDARLERTTHGKGLVADWPWSKLKELRCKEPQHFGLQQEEPARLARLEDVLERLPDAPLNIDLKAADEAGVNRAVSILNAHSARAGNLWRAVITSASSKTQRLIAAKDLAPSVTRGLGKRDIVAMLVRARLGLNGRESWRARALQLPLTQRLLGRRIELIEPRLLTLAHNYGCRIDVWHEQNDALVDHPKLAIALAQMGVDGLFTDDIETMHQALMQP